MATKDPSCDVCLNLHVTKSASVWCSECEEAICKDCEPRHQTQKATKNHKTISVEDYQELPTSIMNIKLECEDHYQKLEFYCSIHNEPCCTRCVSGKHKDCRELKPLAEVVDGVKASAAFSDLVDRVKDMSQVIGQIIQEKRDNKSNLKIQKNTIIAEVERVRKSINKHLDTIQGELLSKIREHEGREGDKIDCLVSTLSKFKTKVDEIANAVDKTRQHASNFQTFMCVHKWNREIENQEKQILSAQSNVDIQMKINPLLNGIDKEIAEFAKIKIEFSPTKKRILRKEKQGQQLLMKSPQSISRIKLSKIKSFHIPTDNVECIRGCDMFEDGRMVFADYRAVNKRLIIMDGSLASVCQLNDCPLDVSIIDSNTVAVTMKSKEGISIVNVNLSLTLRTITLKDKCYGICCTDGKLVVSMANKKIKIVDLFGNVVSTISKMNDATYCSAKNDRIYYAAQSKNIIYCCDLNGCVLWNFNCKKSDYPLGMTHDVVGNVYVTCKDTNKVIVIDSSGKESRELLTSKDDIYHPRAIHYNCKNNILLVCNEFSKCFLYKIST